MAKSLDGLHPVFRRRVEAVLADPEAVAEGVYVVSAFRSPAYQRQLWNAKVASVRAAHPTWSLARVEEYADDWVARPGTSNHGPKVSGFGIAVDFGMRGVKAVSGQWPRAKEVVMLRLGARYRLRTPMEWEDWHYEPIEGAAIRLGSWTPDGKPVPVPRLGPTSPLPVPLEVEMFVYRQSNAKEIKLYEGKGRIRAGLTEPIATDLLTMLDQRPGGPGTDRKEWVLSKETVAWLEGDA